MSTSQPFDTDVGVIGYGSSGVAAAIALGSYGVNAIAIERGERADAVIDRSSSLRAWRRSFVAASIHRGCSAPT